MYYKAIIELEHHGQYDLLSSRTLANQRITQDIDQDLEISHVKSQL